MVKPVMNAQTSHPDIDMDDVQGLVRFGHGHLSESAFLLLAIRDPGAAREWLAQTPVTSARSQSRLPELAVQVAFTASGLGALGVAQSTLMAFSEAFTTGMSGDENLSRRLGDTGSNHPRHWRWGGAAANTPHVLLMIYTLPGKLGDYLQQMLASNFAAAFEVQHTLHATSPGPEEPFGFVDGISQPMIDWKQSMRNDPRARDHYNNLLAPGEVLLGYPNEYGLYTDRPLLHPSEAPGSQLLPTAIDQPLQKDLGRNGSYVVLRQLLQDVPAFWRFIDEQSGSDAGRRDQLAAAMVGRRRDGTPLATLATRPIAGLQADNVFNFDDDPRGRQCPLGAHIRRANPRTGDFPPGVNSAVKRLLRTVGFDRENAAEDLIAASRFHRILRRGRAFGSRLTPEQALSKPPLQEAQEERGLYFVCLGANIARQFEFVQNAWIVNAKFAGLPTESDPLLGNREPLASGAATNCFSQPRAGEPAHCVHDLPQFVTVCGGAYFFMPGLRALTFILQQK